MNLTHAYAHTNDHLNFLPSSLKGADWALYAAASALGLRTKVVSAFSRDNSRTDRHEHFVNKLHRGFEIFDQYTGDYEIEDDQWGEKMPRGKVRWLNEGHASLRQEPHFAYMAVGVAPAPFAL